MKKDSFFDKEVESSEINDIKVNDLIEPNLINKDKTKENQVISQVSSKILKNGIHTIVPNFDRTSTNTRRRSYNLKKEIEILKMKKNRFKVEDQQYKQKSSNLLLSHI